MIEILNKVVSPEWPWTMVPDTVENILQDIENHTLDPVFELYGNFVNEESEWMDEDVAAKYAGCTAVFGNFLTYSHAFRLVTDDADIIARIAAAVEKNKARREYQAAFADMVAQLPLLTKENARAGKYYAFGGGWMKLTRVYRITEDEANEKSLNCMDRFEGVTRDGQTIGGALPGSDILATTENWKL